MWSPWIVVTADERALMNGSQPAKDSRQVWSGRHSVCKFGRNRLKFRRGRRVARPGIGCVGDGWRGIGIEE